MRDGPTGRSAAASPATGALVVCRPRRGPRRGDEAQLPPARRGARARPRGARTAWRARWRRSRCSAAWPRSPVAATGTCATSIHTGNPLPWIHHLGPITLPAPEQALGGREAHSVLSYLTDGTVWSDWFLPGLHGGLWIVWPAPRRRRPRRPHPRPRHPLGWWASSTRRSWIRPINLGFARPPNRGSDVCWRSPGLVGLAAALAWLVVADLGLGPGRDAARLRVGPALPRPGTGPRPRSAPDRAAPPSAACGGVSGERDSEVRQSFGTHSVRRDGRSPSPGRRRALGAGSALVRGRGSRRRLPDPAPLPGEPLREPELHARRASTLPSSGHGTSAMRGSPPPAPASTRCSAPISPTTSTTSASPGPTEASRKLKTCRAWRKTPRRRATTTTSSTTFDRLEPGKPAFPPQARWTEGADAEVILRKSPTVVFRITGPLDPAACPG